MEYKPLGSMVNRKIGYGIVQPGQSVPDGVPVIKVNNLISGLKSPSELDTTARENEAKYSRTRLHGGELIVSVVGTIGKTAIVPKSFAGCNLVRATALIDIEDELMSKWVKYYFDSPCGQSYIEQNLNTTVQPTLNIKSLVEMPIPIRDTTEMKKTVLLLSALDEKIEVNRQINDNLEQQAHSYFQELFVDNASPEWTTGTISDLGTVVGGSTPSKAKPEYYTESGIAWITPKDLSINKSKFIFHGENDITELGLKNSSAAIMPEGTVLFSSRAPIGYIAIAAGEVTTNQGFKSVVPKPEIGTPFVYFFLKNTLPVIEGMASGSTFKEVSGSTMKNVPAVIPDAEILAKFSDFCAPIFAQQRTLEEQNQSLAKLRDSLLPKLMSGEIDVSAVHL